MILDLNREWVDSIMGRILDLAPVCQPGREWTILGSIIARLHVRLAQKTKYHY